MLSNRPTHRLIFNAVRSLKLAQDAEYEGPTQRWFRRWWQENQLHKIKAKPIATVRFMAGQVSHVEEWFVNYRRAIKELNIKKKCNIVNFDEAGFRVGCMKGQEIIVPDAVKEFYLISPEDRRSLTIFESIDASGRPPPPPMLVIQGQDLMQNWFPEGLPPGTRIMTSESGFTSDQIAIEYLKHYILNSDVGPNSDWKLMLMDNHGSHCTPEFIILANENHIRPFSLIPHLTHCMQPLDVGIFQPYKHWHDVAIQESIADFNFEYSIPQFCQDLAKTRERTFKKHTIRSAFQKAGMWPISSTQCIKYVKKYQPSSVDHQKSLMRGEKRGIEANDLPLSDLPLPRIKPQTFNDVETGLIDWATKIKDKTQWSDPTRPDEFQQFINGTKEVVAKSTLTQYELDLHNKRRTHELLQKANCRKRLKTGQTGIGLTSEEAKRIKMERASKEEQVQKTKEHNNFLRLWRFERDEKHRQGVVARKDERTRAKRVKDLMKMNAFISEELLTPIKDPEAEWKASDPTWKDIQMAKEKAKMEGMKSFTIEDENEDEEPLFIMDTIGDDSIRQQVDFIPFNEDEINEDLDSDNIDSNDDDISII